MSCADPSAGNKAKLIKVAGRSQVSLLAPALDTFLPDIVLDSVPELLRLGSSQFGLSQPSPSDVASRTDVAVVIKAGAPGAHGLSTILLAHDGSGKFKFMGYTKLANKRGEAQGPPEITIHPALMDRTYFQSLGNFGTLEWNQFWRKILETFIEETCKYKYPITLTEESRIFQWPDSTTLFN